LNVTAVIHPQNSFLLSEVKMSEPCALNGMRYPTQHDGIPTDEDVRQWRDKLLLCLQEIYAAADYDAHACATDDDYDLDDDYAKPYQTAIDALNALLPPFAE
jgi:hypothetical protein